MSEDNKPIQAPFEDLVAEKIIRRRRGQANPLDNAPPFMIYRDGTYVTKADFNIIYAPDDMRRWTFKFDKNGSMGVDLKDDVGNILGSLIVERSVDGTRLLEKKA